MLYQQEKPEIPIHGVITKERALEFAKARWIRH